MREAAREEAGRQTRQAGSKASYCQAFSCTDFTANGRGFIGCGPVGPAAYRRTTCEGLQHEPGHHVGSVPITTAACDRTHWVAAGTTRMDFARFARSHSPRY